MVLPRNIMVLPRNIIVFHGFPKFVFPAFSITGALVAGFKTPGGLIVSNESSFGNGLQYDGFAIRLLTTKSKEGSGTWLKTWLGEGQEGVL